MPEEILIEIDLDGTTTVEAKGVVGTGCAELTRAIENALGETVEDVKKPEYHKAARAGESARNVNRAGR